MPVWKIILFKVTNTQIRAQNLLTQWHRLRGNGSCADVLNIQQSKDRLEDLSASLTAGMYCVPMDPTLEDKCQSFEVELEKLKDKMHRDLLQGLSHGHHK